MASKWTADDVLRMGRSYQEACVLLAAADLELIAAFGDQSLTAEEVAQQLGTDPRATTILLDALSAIGILEKAVSAYRVPADVRQLLTPDTPESVLAMLQHQGNCLRRWCQLPQVVQRGGPAEVQPSIRGADDDQEAFIKAMNVISGPVADDLVAELQPIEFEHLLDVGGASGTWTIAWLKATPNARATLVDLPDVIPLARERLDQAGLSDRVELVVADYLEDTFPAGADLAWVSAILHQNSRPENRVLFGKVRDALRPGGTILIRELVMDRSRTAPKSGALFAVNMLVGTAAGGTYSFEEMEEDLWAAGFADVALVRSDPWMSSVIRAKKPDD